MNLDRKSNLQSAEIVNLKELVKNKEDEIIHWRTEVDKLKDMLRMTSAENLHLREQKEVTSAETRQILQSLGRKTWLEKTSGYLLPRGLINELSKWDEMKPILDKYVSGWDSLPEETSKRETSKSEKEDREDDLEIQLALAKLSLAELHSRESEVRRESVELRMRNEYLQEEIQKCLAVSPGGTNQSRAGSWFQRTLQNLNNFNGLNSKGGETN
ncbi:hypothetical protein Ciccas_000088 [Cichlidogyrus casuarinus]|uniref:Uncharacterized protein n=1 Tax=Cichlidogyrus casuarinus TaxID=1844966 RepID=A0ABD2QNW5_9PLAT